jgi:hypothetical protein
LGRIGQAEGHDTSTQPSLQPGVYKLHIYEAKKGFDPSRVTGTGVHLTHEIGQADAEFNWIELPA